LPHTCWALANIREREDAVRHGEHANEINPNNANSRNALAQALLWDDQLERATLSLARKYFAVLADRLLHRLTRLGGARNERRGHLLSRK
jgi:hypothetical protein